MPNPSSTILPYPFQLPQDYYAKNTPPVPVPPAPGPTPPVVVTPLPPEEATNQGGVYYGNTPPSNPQYGWLWTTSTGYLYAFIEPGIWQQIATNW